MMGVGTSLGAFYDDGFHQAAAQWDPKKYDADNEMIETPDQAAQNKELNNVELTELGGIEIKY